MRYDRKAGRAAGARPFCGASISIVLDHLRQVIGWRGMAQRDPLNEYKSEAFELFRSLITHGTKWSRRS